MGKEFGVGVFIFYFILFFFGLLSDFITRNIWGKIADKCSTLFLFDDYIGVARSFIHICIQTLTISIFEVVWGSSFFLLGDVF